MSRKVDARARVVGARRASGGSPARDAGQGPDQSATAAGESTVASPCPIDPHAVDADGLTPGARHFLAQRKAQGLDELSDEQADRLAVLFCPVPKAGAA